MEVFATKRNQGSLKKRILSSQREEKYKVSLEHTDESKEVKERQHVKMTQEPG